MSQKHILGREKNSIDSNSRSKTIKHNQKRGPSTTVVFDHPKSENTMKIDQKRPIRCFSLPWPNRRAIVSHQTALPRPATRMTAGHCSSSVAASSMAGKTCPLRVHTCGPLIDEMFSKKVERICHEIFFFGRQRRSMGLSEVKQSHQKLVPPKKKKTIKHHVSFWEHKTRFVSRDTTGEFNHTAVGAFRMIKLGHRERDEMLHNRLPWGGKMTANGGFFFRPPIPAKKTGTLQKTPEFRTKFRYDLLV